MRIGVVLASRGMVFSKTMESIWQNIRYQNASLFMAHDLPIPDCFNVPLKQALKEKPQLIWFVEEDMVIPEGTLDRMIEVYLDGYGVVAAAYADRRTGNPMVQLNNKGEVLYCPMGCLLVDASAFDLMDEPYIRQGVFWHIDTDDGDIDLEYHPEITNTGYGTQDIWLSWKLRSLGYQIKLIPARIGHLQLLQRSEDIINNGQHQIKEVYLK